jgi:hypothetical protein
MENVIELNGSLKELHVESILINTIVEKIQMLFPNNLSIVKGNTYLILEICNAIEDSYKKQKKGKKVNKLDIFFKIYSGLFGNISNEDKQTLTNNIDYLHRNGDIKATSLSKKIVRFIKKKFLA